MKMTSKRWTQDQMNIFLSAYENKELLWNVRHEDYFNKAKREAAFETIIKELAEKRMKCTTEELKRKIRIIRTIYRREKIKAEKSKKRACNPEDIYIPSLMWFQQADRFLGAHIMKKGIILLNDNEHGMFEGYDDFGDEDDDVDMQMTPNKKLKRSGNDNPVTSNEKHDDEDDEDIFGKYIARQMRKLPENFRVLMQQEIQNLFTQYYFSAHGNIPQAVESSTLHGVFSAVHKVENGD